MSAFFSWQQAILRSELEPTTRLVCLTIGCHMAMDGSGCFPSYATIAGESGLNRATVIKHVQKAADAGFLAVEGRFVTGADGKVESTSNRYRPLMPQVVANDNHPSRPAQPPLVVHDDPNSPSLTPQITNPPTPKGEPDGFAEFWSAYPNKVGKPKSMAVWRRIKADHADVMAGLRRWKSSAQWTKDKGAFIPHPTTWLNREGWNDAIAGEAAPIPTATLEAMKLRSEESDRAHKEKMDRLVVANSNRLLGRTP